MLTLTEAEIVEITGHKRCDAQRRALDFMGIVYRIRPNGRLLVLRSAVEQPGTMKPREPELQP